MYMPAQDEKCRKKTQYMYMYMYMITYMYMCVYMYKYQHITNETSVTSD